MEKNKVINIGISVVKKVLANAVGNLNDLNEMLENTDNRQISLKVRLQSMIDSESNRVFVTTNNLNRLAYKKSQLETLQAKEGDNLSYSLDYVIRSIQALERGESGDIPLKKEGNPSANSADVAITVIAISRMEKSLLKMIDIRALILGKISEKEADVSNLVKVLNEKETEIYERTLEIINTEIALLKSSTTENSNNPVKDIITKIQSKKDGIANLSKHFENDK